MRFTIKDDELYFGKLLGPTSALYADANEGLSGNGVVGDVQTPHRIDYIFVSEDRVVGVESKTLNDLISSWLCGRLQRQLRILFETVDIPVLMLRGIGGLKPYKMLEGFPALMDDLLKFQIMSTAVSHGLIHFASRHDAMGALDGLKEILDGKKNLRTVIADRYEKKQVRGTVREKNLQLIGGCGLVRSKKLAEFGSLRDVLNATEGELKKVMNKTMLASVRRLKR